MPVEADPYFEEPVILDGEEAKELKGTFKYGLVIALELDVTDPVSMEQFSDAGTFSSTPINAALYSGHSGSDQAHSSPKVSSSDTFDLADFKLDNATF